MRILPGRIGAIMTEEPIETEDEAWGVTERLLADVRAAVVAADGAGLSALLDDRHPADVAHLLEQIDAKERRELLTAWPGNLDGDVLSELTESLREEVIEQLNPAELAEAVRDLESDDVVDLVE